MWQTHTHWAGKYNPLNRFWRHRKELLKYPVERKFTHHLILDVATCRTVDIHIISILLPLTNQTLDELGHTLFHFEKLYDTCSANSPLMILGDLNAQLSHGYDDKNLTRRVKEQFLDEVRQLSVSNQWDAIGPAYLYVAHSGKQTTLIYHVVISEEKLDFVKQTGITCYYFLNYSDQFKIFSKISLEAILIIKSEMGDNESGSQMPKNSSCWHMHWQALASD